MKYWFKFRFKDWLTSNKIKMMTPEQKGAYIDLLCMLHTLEVPSKFQIGKLKMTLKNIQNWSKIDLRLIKAMLDLGVILYDEKEGVYYQPNIRKEAELSESNRVGGIERGKQLAEQNAKRVVKRSPQRFSDSDSTTLSSNSNKDNILNKVGVFYEKNIGMLKEHICQELELLEKEHGEDNVIKALKLTVEAGANGIRYPKAILDSEAVGGYEFKKVPKSTDDPLLKRLAPVIRKQVEKKIEDFICNTGTQPKEANIKLMIKKIEKS